MPLYSLVQIQLSRLGLEGSWSRLLLGPFPLPTPPTTARLLPRAPRAADTAASSRLSPPLYALPASSVIAAASGSSPFTASIVAAEAPGYAVVRSRRHDVDTCSGRIQTPSTHLSAALLAPPRAVSLHHCSRATRPCGSRIKASLPRRPPRFSLRPPLWKPTPDNPPRARADRPRQSRWWPPLQALQRRDCRCCRLKA